MHSLGRIAVRDRFAGFFGAIAGAGLLLLGIFPLLGASPLWPWLSFAATLAVLGGVAFGWRYAWIQAALRGQHVWGEVTSELRQGARVSLLYRYEVGSVTHVCALSFYPASPAAAGLKKGRRVEIGYVPARPSFGVPLDVFR